MPGQPISTSTCCQSGGVYVTTRSDLRRVYVCSYKIFLEITIIMNGLVFKMITLSVVAVAGMLVG